MAYEGLRLPKQTVVGHEEKCFVLAFVEPRERNRTTEEEAEVVHDRFRPRETERIARIQNGILKVFKKSAMSGVRPAFRDRRNVADAAELRRVIDLAHADLRD